MYSLITPSDLGYNETELTLSAVSASLITSGNGCLSSAQNIYEDNGLNVRNKVNRTILAFRNDHESLTAYARIKTVATVMTLPIADIEFEMPAGSSIFIVKGFSSIFQGQGDITVQLSDSLTTQQQVNDLLFINLSHDSTEPAISFGAFYV
jgi:hypothetical protein